MKFENEARITNLTEQLESITRKCEDFQRALNTAEQDAQRQEQQFQSERASLRAEVDSAQRALQLSRDDSDVLIQQLRAEIDQFQRQLAANEQERIQLGKFYLDLLFIVCQII